MIALSLHQINAKAPYLVECEANIGLFKFVSDNGTTYGIAFEKDDLLQTTESYQFAITNYGSKKAPRDYKVRETVDVISEYTQTVFMLSNKPKTIRMKLWRTSFSFVATTIGSTLIRIFVSTHIRN